MPLVFVHGVNVRKGKKPKEQEGFEQSVNARNGLFQTIGFAGLVLPPAKLHIENPYWGDNAAQFVYDLISVPAHGTEEFGGSDDVMAQVLTATVPYDVAVETADTTGGAAAVLLTLARKGSLVLAVDAVVAAAANRPLEEAPEEVAKKNDELAAFAAQAVAYAAAQPDTTWLNATLPTGELRLQDDNQFLEALAARVQEAAGGASTGGPETFGISAVLARLKDAAAGLAGAAKNTARGVIKAVSSTVIGGVVGGIAGAAVGGAPGVVVRALRPIATQRAGIFVGDVFTYLDERGTKDAPGSIVKIIIDALDAAVAKQLAPDTKLVVIAHSMGGNIVYDILTHYRPDIQVDLLVTVGSQVALFKEMALYKEDAGVDRAASRPARVERPAAVKAWINVFDPLDMLGFAAEGVFNGVTDFAFSTQASPLDAHGLYFFQSSFHHRLRARMAGVGLGVAP